MIQREGSSFLKKGVTFAIFSITGKVPVQKERFIIKDIGLLKGFSNNQSIWISKLPCFVQSFLQWKMIVE